MVETGVTRRFTRLQADILLLVTAVVWGGGMVVQRLAANNLGVFLFNGLRFLLGGLALLALGRFQLRLTRREWLRVSLLGLMLFGASAFQQAGLKTTTAGNAGFLTGLYVVLVPLGMLIFLRQRSTWLTWAAALLAAAGTFLLSGSGGNFQLFKGDGLEMIGAFLWAAHVLLVARFAPKMDARSLAIGQFLTCSLFNLALGSLLEWQTWPGALTSIGALLYSGLISVGLGFTLQVVGQQYAPATDASLILSMEAVFAALLGALFLGESFKGVQMVGCGLILAAMLLAQLKPGQPAPSPADSLQG